jgi:hypothetical protein
MRKVLAILLSGLFLILFLVTITVNRLIDTASDPGVIIGMVNDAEAYDYVYDNIVANLVHDIVVRGFVVDTGLDAAVVPAVLQFDDPDAAAEAILGLVETLLPREYVKEKFEESLNSLAPYLKGETNEFTIDLEVQERVRAVPEAARALVIELNLTERVIDDLLIPQVEEFSSQVSGEGLGINLTEQEINETARAVFEPEWLEGQVFSAIDEVTPYFAGDSESFNVVLRFEDRLVIVGEILKDKLAREDTLYNLVFTQVIDPLIKQTVAQSTAVGFGISLTEQDVTEAFEIIAPRAWVREQGDGVIDSLIDYMTGSVDELEYTIALTDRKTAATVELQVLARKKLQPTLGSIPDCTSTAAAVGAGQDVASRKLPRCLAGGQVTVNVALATFGSVMDTQIESFVDTQIPDQLSYSLADFQTQIGGGLDIVEDLRKRVSEGISFTDQDLIDAMAIENNAASRADAEKQLRILADGVLFTEKDIVDRLDPGEVRQLDDIRGYVKLALRLRWLLWVPVLLSLIGIGFIGGREWPGRLKWAGGVAAVSALIVYLAITVGWSVADIATDRIPDYKTDISAEFRADYPRLAAEIASDEPLARIQRGLDSWQRGWRSMTLPWMFVGIVAFAAGILMECNRTIRWGPLHKSSGPSAAVKAAAKIPSVIVVDVPAEDEESNDNAPGNDRDSESGPRTS